MYYTFRCIADVEADVIRDILIDGTANLEELHKIIFQSFGLSSGEMASFYHTNNNWEQGEEIPLFDTSDTGTSKEMKDWKLTDIFKKEDDRLLYIYDFFKMWTFFVMLYKINESAASSMPALVFSLGSLPKEAPDKNFLVAESIDDSFEDIEDDFNENLSNLF